jgi:hypothetical protein
MGTIPRCVLHALLLAWASVAAGCIDPRFSAEAGPGIPYAQAHDQLIADMTAEINAEAPPGADVAVTIDEGTYNDHAGWILLTCSFTVTMPQATKEQIRFRLRDRLSARCDRLLETRMAQGMATTRTLHAKVQDPQPAEPASPPRSAATPAQGPDDGGAPGAP